MGRNFYERWGEMTSKPTTVDTLDTSKGSFRLIPIGSPSIEINREMGSDPSNVSKPIKRVCSTCRRWEPIPGTPMGYCKLPLPGVLMRSTGKECTCPRWRARR
jgi:hypothetical protein